MDKSPLDGGITIDDEEKKLSSVGDHPEMKVSIASKRGST